MKKHKILFVDDDVNILAAIQRHLQKIYDVSTENRPEEALQRLVSEGPFAVVVSDFRMPGMDGVRFLSESSRVAPDAVRIMLTGQADMQAAINAINEGHLFRFLLKPCLTELIIQTVNDAVRQYGLVMAERELLDKTLNGSVKMLAELLSVVRPMAFSRSLRAAELARCLAEKMGVAGLWEIEVASRLSQIGMLAVPPDVLDKQENGGNLSVDEKQMLDEHMQNARKFMGGVPRLEDVADGIAYQNKRFDGGGTPVNSIAGEEIPFIGRLLKVVLDFERKRLLMVDPDAALDALLSDAGAYDPNILVALKSIVIGQVDGPIEKIAAIKELAPGFILADDVKATDGRLLIPRGTALCEINILLLANIEQRGHLIKPIRIFKAIN